MSRLKRQFDVCVQSQNDEVATGMQPASTRRGGGGAEKGCNSQQLARSKEAGRAVYTKVDGLSVCLSGRRVDRMGGWVEKGAGERMAKGHVSLSTPYSPPAATSSPPRQPDQPQCDPLACDVDLPPKLGYDM